MKKYYSLLIYMFLAILLSCSKNGLIETKQFVKLNPVKTNLDFTNKLTSSPDLNIFNYLYYYNGAGVAIADFNNDGLDDLYFTGNQVLDELYINKGNLSFEKKTKEAKLNTDINWSTGVTHVDINNDGKLDIYVCKASGYKNLKGRNLLYVNYGNNSNGTPQFKEESEKYGLDFSGLSTQASFFDYDLDGDLDMYLMNHSVHPSRTYGKGKQRMKFDSISGDILFENKNGYYKDVSSSSGIFQGKSGYGLGLAISDLNNDNYPDIYIGNDFFENDYLYINQKNGTFKELISSNSSKIGHTTHFSMGNAIADLNNDGLYDILSLDMLPENLETYKTSGLEYSYPIYQQYLKDGFAPQYMSNTLQLNLGYEQFSEIGNLAGISATEWSWGPLIADFNNDGLKDIYITNGIKAATNDMDYINFISNEDIQRRIDKGVKKTDLPLINEIPEKKNSNYFFKNQGDLKFKNVTSNWFNKEPSFSNGCAYADLDNDGDLEIIVNNVNEKAYILENTNSNGSFLKINFKGEKENLFGIGAQAIAYTSNGIIAQQNFPTRGYLSSVSNTLHIGLRNNTIIDSLKIIWPNKKSQILKQVNLNKSITVSIKNAKNIISNNISKNQKYNTNDSIINFKHKESTILDFNREPLIPYAKSNKGPYIDVVDFNKDGLEDFLITGAKKQASEIFVQKNNGAFESLPQLALQKETIDETTASVFFDVNGDNQLDLIVANGGNEFKTGKPLRPKLYLNKKGKLVYDDQQFKNIELNASKIDTVDIDNDGVLEIFIASDGVPSEFGKTPQQYLFKNDKKGNFKDITAIFAPTLQKIGSITDFIWEDLDHNGYLDLIVTGHWMPISIFLNNGKKLVLQKKNGLQQTNGLWNSIESEDFDNDGDLDFVCGNWGLNTKLKATLDKPLKLYRKDFDNNGTIEPIVTYYHNDKETPFASKDELAKQIPSLNKKFLSYKAFANASLQDIFGKNNLNNSDIKQVFELESCYFENDGNGNYTKHSLPLITQSSSIFDFAIDDVNKDGFKDLLIVGNNYEISTQLGRLDGFHGLVLENDQNGNFIWNRYENLNISGAARVIKPIKIKNKECYIVGINNGTPILLIKN